MTSLLHRAESSFQTGSIKIFPQGKVKTHWQCKQVSGEKAETSHGEDMICLLKKLFKFSPQLGVSSVCLPKEASQTSCSLHSGFHSGCAKQSIISPDATYCASSTEQGDPNTQPPPGLNWEVTLPSTLTENSVGFHSKSRNYLGAHKIVGLLPGREMMPEGNGRGDMEGKSVGMEQMPHVAGMEGLTPFSTLFWRE